MGLMSPCCAGHEDSVPMALWMSPSVWAEWFMSDQTDPHPVTLLATFEVGIWRFLDFVRPGKSCYGQSKSLCWAPGARSNAGWTNTDSPEKEAARDNAELFDCQVQLGSPREEENRELVAEAEAMAAGWMLDFLCLSLCRAFRDGRCEDFRQTRDSAEGE